MSSAMWARPCGRTWGGSAASFVKHVRRARRVGRTLPVRCERARRLPKRNRIESHSNRDSNDSGAQTARNGSKTAKPLFVL